MTTTLERLCRALAMAAFLVLVSPASSTAEDVPAPDAALAEALALFDTGRFEEALAVLRPLTSEREINADVVFLVGMSAIEASRLVPADDPLRREVLLEEAVLWLREMLVARPELVRVRLELARREYAGSRFDETNVAIHAGPRWLIDRRTEMSLLGSVRRRWAAGEIDYNAGGVRLQAARRLSPRFLANIRGSWERRVYRTNDHLDGPVTDVLLGGRWTITPLLRANAAYGIGRERPETENRRHESRRLRAGLSTILPLGFNVSASTQLRWTDHEGNWSLFTGGPLREDLTRTQTLSVFKRDFTIYGFAPQVVVTHEERTSNASGHEYDRTRAELRFVHQF